MLQVWAVIYVSCNIKARLKGEVVGRWEAVGLKWVLWASSTVAESQELLELQKT